MDLGSILLVDLLLTGGLAVLLNHITHKITKNGWISFPISIILAIPICTSLINEIFLPMYSFNCSGVGCIFVGMGTVVILVLFTLLVYVGSTITFSLIRTYRKRKENSETKRNKFKQRKG